MPRFYFDLYDDLRVPDAEGRELAGIEAARAVAVCEAREMMTEAVLAGAIDLQHRIEVRDESGNVVLRVAFEDAVTVRNEKAV